MVCTTLLASLQEWGAHSLKEPSFLTLGGSSHWGVLSCWTDTPVWDVSPLMGRWRQPWWYSLSKLVNRKYSFCYSGISSVKNGFKRQPINDAGKNWCFLSTKCIAREVQFCFSFSLWFLIYSSLIEQYQWHEEYLQYLLKFYPGTPPGIDPDLCQGTHHRFCFFFKCVF